MASNGISDKVDLKPALASVREACRYLGGISRAKLYADILPRLETVKLGNRRLIVIVSLDRFIAACGQDD